MSGNTAPRKMPKYFFFGALRLDYDSAECADTAKQNFCVQARSWYIDATFRCEACETEFVFSAKEQRFWYEEQRFYVDSMPRKCPECRKQDRKIKLLRQQYDSLISGAISGKDLATKKAVVEIMDDLALTSYCLTDGMTEHRRVLVKQIGKQQAEPDAAPNGSPATRLGNSEITKGPPSVT